MAINKIFLTGGTGTIGTEVARDLVAHGYAVRGLARSDASAAKLQALGVTPVRGDLTTLDVARAEAAAADAVVHLAIDFARVIDSGSEEQAFVEAVGDVLKGTGKTFIGTSGTYIGVGTGKTPFTEADDGRPGAFRYKFESTFRSLGDDGGVRAIVIRPSLTHSDKIDGFPRTVIAKPRELGFAPVLDGGEEKWTYNDLHDVAVLFRLALEKAPAGFSRYHGTDESTSNRQIAEIVAAHWGVPVREATREELTEAYGFFATFFGKDNTVSSVATREQLGWEPKGARFIDLLKDGTYFKQL
ncbi:putative protein [Vanrija pseudolonga]|uniref:Purtative protein n=1 Tax=Vanrija pseudolonga TaxID=143232 RepID=A0AAF1BJN4_9TREE|nr:purtative protein [Vanrija pseudolonga]